ncbi:CASP-like protein 1E2 [Typha angustifolia]|uniref:CASP-like protein 1E2 n=1 Tax=Typha angustifolia TaxID=59011 RepID=UPI003C2FB989
MESKVEPGFDGVVSEQKKAEAGATSTRVSSLVLRIVVVATTLVAAVVLAVDRQSKTVSISLVPTLPPLAVTVTAKSTDSSPFIYFIVANCITSACSALSLLISIAKRARNRNNVIMSMAFVDLLVVAVLFSGIGAAATFGVLGERGNSHVRWNKVCDVYDKFCAKGMISIGVSLVGGLAQLLLVMLSIVGLHKRSL